MPYFPNQNNKFPKATRLAWIIKIALALVVVIFFLQFWVINRLSTYGEKIAEIKRAKAKLQIENRILENSVAFESSLLEVSRKAKSLGFEPVINIEYIK